MTRKMHAVRIGDTASGAWHRYDPRLLGLSLALLTAGLIMVASASVTLAERLHAAPLYYFQRQLSAVLAGLLLGCAILKIPLSWWEKYSTIMLFLAIALLALVLFPGLGREVNGSRRWLSLGPVNLQCSEPAKVFIIAYLAAYMARRERRLRSTFIEFLRPLAVVTLPAFLLLSEPDYGAAVIIFLAALGMLFMTGAPWSRFLVGAPLVVAGLAASAALSSYRLARLQAFIDPWQDPFDSGYQLIQSLIAFGRGEWLGVGLGGSVQKLFYLTQAHTDFIFAIAAEELGLAFILPLILAFFLLSHRAFAIGRDACRAGKSFAAYLAYGAGLVLGIQAFVHMGVNVGMLPTKGLPLPLFSYGVNSVLASCALIALLLRIDFETRYYADMNVATPPPARAADSPPALRQMELPWRPAELERR